MKAAVIAIVGRPSVGKSTLLNSLCGRKVSIVSAAPQTTRNTIRGVLTDPRGQLVFIDTPGFHLSNRKINLRMKSLVAESLREVDVTLYLVDSTRPPGEEERAIAETLAASPTRVVVALTKIDLIDGALSPADSAAARLDSGTPESAGAVPRGVASLLSELLPEAPLHRVSALSSTGLQDLVDQLFDLAPEGEQMYPEEFYTDQPPEFRVSEIIREKAIERVRQEVPHALYVEVADMELPNREPERTGSRPGAPASAGSVPSGTEEMPAEQRLWIRAFLIVERESQKGILIGRGGAMIKEIRVSAQREIEEIFPYRVHLDLRVKVNPKWRKSDPTLKRLIY